MHMGHTMCIAFLNPCHRCRLAKLFGNQFIAGDNIVATGC